MNTRVTVRFACSYHLVQLVLLLGLLVCLSHSATAQVSTSTNDGGTPPGIAPGAPAGAYPLSGLEQLNHYNGRLSINIPLLQVGGRGSAGYTIPLNIGPRPWIITSYAVPPPPPYSQVYWYHAPSEYWSGMEAGYRPGVMQLRRSGDNPYQEYDENFYWSSTLTRLFFTRPDGTEFELVDQLTGGTRQSGTGIPDGFNRGKIFVTRDGSAATFIADYDIQDRSDTYAAGVWEVSGYLFLRDGTRYRIDDGGVSWIRDRNGNKVTFSSNTITDSLNRQITITSGVNAGYPYGVCDEITYRGFGGATRTIRISKTNLANALRSGETIKTYAQLFPELNGAGGTTYDPGDIVSALWLPDGRSYQFRYNSYGEIARVELPTGGAVEYDYEAGSATGPASGTVGDYNEIQSLNPLLRLGIYRRLKEKRTYVNGSTLENKMVYVRPVVASPGLSAEVKHYDGAGIQLSGEKHYYYGDPETSILYSIPTYLSLWNDGKEYQTDALAANGTTLLRRETQTWADAALPGGPRITETNTTLSDTNQVTKQTFSYDQYNNKTDVYEYDYGTSAPPSNYTRRTHTAYLTSGYDTISGGTSNPDATATIHLRSLPTQTKIYDAGGILRAQTSFEYDNYNQGSSDVFHAALTDRSSISGLVSRSNQSPGGSYSPTIDYLRGNVTKTTQYLLDTSGNVTDSISGYAQYDIAGNVVKTVDPRSTTSNIIATTFEFSDRFGSPDGNAQNNDTLPSPGSSWLGTQVTYAFPTKVTNALGHIAYTQFDYFLGKPVDTEDPNNVKSSLYYDDALDRPTKGINAVGTTVATQTRIYYDDNNRLITTVSDKDSFGQSDNINGSGLKSAAKYDGLGRTWRAGRWNGSQWEVADTEFDALGRQYRSSNPYAAGDLNGAVNPPGLWTITDYDALSRVIKLTTPDGAHVDTEYLGNKVTVTDQAGKKRKSETDALGRLTKVWEDPTGLNYQTDYQYDVLGNLTQVSQGGQTRTFTYDSLKRLLSADNPENGIINNYQYDANSNLLSKTNARGITTNYQYDALNRNTQVSYSSYPDGSMTTQRYYDPAIPYGKGRLDYEVSYNYGMNANGVPYCGGAVSSACGPSGEMYQRTVIGEYDAMGRVKSQSQGFLTYIGGNWVWQDFGVSRIYNAAGQVTSQTYPSGRSVNYSYDVAGRTTNFGGTLGDGSLLTYATAQAYNAAGLLTYEQFNTSTTLYHRRTYNSRLQPNDIRLGTASVDWNRGALQLRYGSTEGVDATDNNGNITRLDHWAPIDDIASQWHTTYTRYEYDGLNRIQRAREDGQSQSSYEGLLWVQKFDYDRWGNRTIHAGDSWGGVNEIQYQILTASNRYKAPTDSSSDAPTDKMRYDAVGNLIFDTWTGGGGRGYDAENKMTWAVGQNGLMNYYIYDASGHRVRRKLNNNAEEWWQVYGIEGELVAEYKWLGTSAQFQKEYGYRNGQLLVAWDSGETGDKQLQWFVQDHLGSPRIQVGSSGAITSTARHDYLPFGEELFAGVGNRATTQGYTAAPSVSPRQKFGSKERDIDTGLDYSQFRYYSPVQGRFTSPDPVGHAASDEDDPQSWNLYSYVRNNPPVYSDPNGLKFKLCDLNGQCSVHNDANVFDWRRQEGIIFNKGKIFDRDGNQIGTYRRLSEDTWTDFQNGLFFGNAKDPGLAGRAQATKDAIYIVAAINLSAPAAIFSIEVLTGAAFEGASSYLLTVRAARPFSHLTLDQLKALIKGKNQLLAEWFRSGSAQIPRWLNSKDLKVYLEIALRDIAKGNGGVDVPGVGPLQYSRLLQILKALGELK